MVMILYLNLSFNDTSDLLLYDYYTIEVSIAVGVLLAGTPSQSDSWLLKNIIFLLYQTIVQCDRWGISPHHT